MASKQWVQTHKIYCDRLGKEVFLLEERIYPGDVMPEASFHVHQQKCSDWLACNITEYPCCWSGINSDYDPFVNTHILSTH